MRNAAYWIETLGLLPHPEGGFYRETYRSEFVINHPPGFPGPRLASTAIYFLLQENDFSALHRLRSDELWHFYAGSPLLVHSIDPQGNYAQLRIGDGNFQDVVKAGCWFGSHLEDPLTYALVGCTVAPGFDFADFEMADRQTLTAQYPQHRGVIERLTRLS